MSLNSSEFPFLTEAGGYLGIPVRDTICEVCGTEQLTSAIGIHRA